MNETNLINALGLLAWILSGLMGGRVARQAGYSFGAGLLVMVPLLNAILMLIFVFARWPVVKDFLFLQNKTLELETELNVLKQKLSEAETSLLDINSMNNANSVSEAPTHKGMSAVENAAYAIVAGELESGRMDPSLWLRAEVLANGNPKQQRLEYIKIKVMRLLAK